MQSILLFLGKHLTTSPGKIHSFDKIPVSVVGRIVTVEFLLPTEKVNFLTAFKYFHFRSFESPRIDMRRSDLKHIINFLSIVVGIGC